MATTRDRLLRAYRRELGTKESPRGSNKVRYSKAYGLIGPWCHEFISVVAVESGAGDIVPWAAYTPAGAAWFKERGRWHSTPKKGAIVYFEFPGMNRISHVGVVEAVHSDGTITSIEGNTDSSGGRTGGKVMRKRRPRSLVAGYGYPAYISEAHYQAQLKAEAKRAATARAKAQAAAAAAKKKAAAALATKKAKAAAAALAAALAAAAAAAAISTGGVDAQPAPRPSATATSMPTPTAKPTPKPTPTATYTTPARPAKPVLTRVIAYRPGRRFQSGGDVRRVAALVGCRRVSKGWGPTCDKAVRKWQRAHGLKVDGEFGAKSAKAAGWTWHP